MASDELLSQTQVSAASLNDTRESKSPPRRSSCPDISSSRRRSSSSRRRSAQDPYDVRRQITQFLLEAQEVESRLREHILELVEPTLRRQNIVESKLKDVLGTMASMRSHVDDLLKRQDSTGDVNSTLYNFRAELAEWDKDRHDSEMQVSVRLSAQENEINTLRQSLELLRGAGHQSVDRTLQSMGDMLTQYKDENTDLRRFCVERLDLNRDKNAKLRDEFETRTLVMENKMHVLQDMQTRANTKITHLDDVVTRMDAKVNESCQGVADLEKSKVSLKIVEQQQQDMGEFMRHVNSVVSSVKLQFGSLTDDVKAHFETATQVVGKSTAKQMETVRSQYTEDMHCVEKLRDDIGIFVSSQKANADKMTAEIETMRTTASSSFADLNKSIDQINQKRESDQKNLEVELCQTRKLLRGLETFVSETDDPGFASTMEGPAPSEGTAETVVGQDSAIDTPAITSSWDGSPAANRFLRESGLHDAFPTPATGSRGGSGTDFHPYTSHFSYTSHAGCTSNADSRGGGFTKGTGFHGKAALLETLIESACMGLACELQDETDRKSVGLYGFKDSSFRDKGMGLPNISSKSLMSSTFSPGSSPRRSRGGSTAFGFDSPRKFRGSEKQRRLLAPANDFEVTQQFAEPVMSIDSRCLSCSGSNATVLAGFKMACLNYNPGSVEYEGTVYSRSELVQKRMELLQQAKQLLMPQRSTFRTVVIE